MLSTKFQVSWPFDSREDTKNRFSRWRPSWISDRNDFSYFYFLSTSHPLCFLQSFKSVGLSVQEKQQFTTDYEDGGHLGFSIRTILALQVTPMLPTKFQVSWPFNSEIGISIGTILAIFGLQAIPVLPPKFCQLTFQLTRRREKQIFMMAAMVAILDFRSEWF